MTRIMSTAETFHQQRPTTYPQPSAPPPSPLLRSQIESSPSSISHIDKHHKNILIQLSRPALTLAIHKMDARPQPIPLAQSKPKTMNDQKSPLHSILKKSNIGQPEHHKTTRLLLERPDGTNVLRNPSAPVTPHPERAVAETSKEGRQTTTTKPHFSLFKGVRNVHRRPVVLRRKTTQTAVPRTTSPPLPRRNHSQPVLPFDVLKEDAFPQPLGQEMESSDEDVPESYTSSSPIDMPASLSQQSTESTTPPQTSSFIDALRESRSPFIHPSVSVSADNHSSALPRKTKTASAVPQLFNNHDKRHEIEYHSPPTIYRTYYTEQPEGTNVPGFTNAKRIPMSENMMDDLVSIVANPHPVQSQITVPSQPWIRSEGTWHKPSGKQPLHDWMIRDSNLPQNPQPSCKPLVAKGFRTRFAEMQAVIATERAQEKVPPVHRRKGKKYGRRAKQGDGKLGSSAPMQSSTCRELGIAPHASR